MDKIKIKKSPVKSSIITFILLIFSLIVVSGFSGCLREDNKQNLSQVDIQGRTGINSFRVDIADDFAEQTNGLMGRKILDNNEGMLFIFEDEKIQGFWMKDTLIPLDMIFISSNLTVIDINKNSLPCKDGEPCRIYHSAYPAKYVLEINGGMSDNLDISTGDKVKISI